MSILFFTLMGCLVRSEKDQNGADQSDNAQPVIESVQITPDTGVVIGTSLTCYAIVNDEEDGSFEPSYEWRVNGVSVGDSPGFTVTSESGATVNSSIQCVATATDSGGRSVTLSSEVRLENTDPVIAAVDIDADTGPDVYNTSILTCQIEADDPNQTELTDIEYTWKVIGETEETLSNTANIDLSDFEISPETDIKCEVLVTDDHSGFATASASVKVSNRAPEFIEPPSLTWTPTNGEGPEANAVVNCFTDAIDPDGEEPTVVRSWLLNEQPVFNNATTVDLSTVSVSVGDAVECQISATDGFGGEAVESVTVMVMNTEPELTGPPVIDPSQSVFADSLVSCSAAATDLNDGELTPTYQWENVTMAVNLGAGDSIQLTPSIASIGDEIRCTATATDFDFAERSSTTSVVIENKPPEMTAPTEISPNQNVTTGDELICYGYGFDIDQSVGLIEGYLWTNNTTNEPLGTTNTYTVDSTNTDVGDVLVCTYSVEDSGGLTVTNSASVTIENTNPVISNLSISPQNPYNDQPITCSGQVTDIDDAANPTITYTWRNGTQSINSGATLANPYGLSVMPDDVLECYAYAEDDNGGSVQQSVFVTVANRPPSMLTVEILPQEPEEGVDDLICLGDGSTDADNQPLSNSYVWTSSSGVTINGDTVPAFNLIEGETWTCAATVTDGIAQVTQTETVVVGPYCEYGTCDFTLDVGNSIQMEMNLIPAGVDPLERYEITQDFYMGTTEVTQEVAEELLVSISAPSNNIGSGLKYPYNASSWHENAYLANLVTDKHNDTEGSTLEHCYDCDNNGSSVECYPNQNPYLCDGYRLPTSAEWEYAARSGTTSDFWTGNGSADGGDYDSDACSSSVTVNDSVSSSLQDFAWFCGNQNSNNYTTLTKPVAQKLPNGFGLYDMHGNVSERTTEWTYQDFSSFDFPAQYANPYQFDEWGDHAIIRGGNGGERPSDIRSGQWSMESLSTNASSTFGLRLVRTVRTIPSEPEILISPEFNDGTSDMICEVDVDSIDPNELTVSYFIEWELNGQAYSGAVSTTNETGDTIPASALSLGDTFRCIVTPDNGIQSGFEVIAQSGVCDTTACDQSIPLGDGSGIDFVLIKEGFEPLGQYQIHQDFYMMTVEVTQNMFHELLEFHAHDDISSLPQGYINNDLPAGGMSWFEAAFFANALTDRHNFLYSDSLDYCYECQNNNGVIYCTESMPPKACNGYSLPTEAEWMYAARSHSPTDFWTGGGSNGGGSATPATPANYCGNGVDDTTIVIYDGDVNPPLSFYAWFCGNAENIDYFEIMKPGAELLPNGFGLFDMHGNLSEWTADQFVNNPLAGVDPWNTGDGLSYILKGGGWSDTTSLLTAGSRMSFAPGQGIDDTGVRLVRRVVSSPSAVTLSFFSPSETTPLICEIDSVAVDPNNDDVYYQFDWYFNEVPYTGQPAMTYHEDDTIPAIDLSPGNWACHVTPTDLVHEGPTIIIEVDL